MSELPPIFLLFDFTALLAGRTREWQEFPRVGKCFVPQVVYEEIQAIGRVGVDRSQEQTAREFTRFFGDSDWQLTGAGAAHASLQPTSGQIYSRRTRLALSIAECAHGFARNSSGRLVVLVSNDQTLLQRIHGLGIANLCGIPATALLIWGRSGRRPAIVAQHLQAMRSTTVTVGTMPRASQARGAVTVTQTKPAARTISKSEKPRPVRSISSHPLSNRPGALYQILSGVSALLAATIAITIVWYVVQPKGLNEFLRHRSLPTLPEMPTSQN